MKVQILQVNKKAIEREVMSPDSGEGTRFVFTSEGKTKAEFRVTANQSGTGIVIQCNTGTISVQPKYANQIEVCNSTGTNNGDTGGVVKPTKKKK